MAIIPNFLIPISSTIDNMVPNNYIVKIQETLIRSGMYVRASDIITLASIIGIALGLIAAMLSLLTGFNLIIAFLIGFITPSLLIGLYIFSVMERRVDAIEKSTPDFLRQIASLLRAGIGLETALEDVSKHGSGPLTDELKRAVIEIKIGSTFDDAIMAMSERLKSKNLERTFRMILEGRRTGGSLSEVIETVAEDLRAVLALKRERRANVMMSIMFLLIAAVIAAPFALGMIMVYSGFIEALGKPNPLLSASITAASGYIIIHSIIAGLLMGIILYGSARKGIKFSLALAPLAYIIFFIVKTVAMGFMKF
jgi:flagellar protein FlaJ